MKNESMPRPSVDEDDAPLRGGAAAQEERPNYDGPYSVTMGWGEWLEVLEVVGERHDEIVERGCEPGDDMRGALRKIEDASNRFEYALYIERGMEDKMRPSLRELAKTWTQ